MSNPPFGRFPLNNTTPFTFRDSYTFLELLNQFLQTVDTVEKNEIEFKEAVNAALAAGKEEADAFVATMTDKYADLLTKLIGYTIEVGVDKYRASMMDGSVFEAYTVQGVDTQLNEFKTEMESNVSDAVDSVGVLAGELQVSFNTFKTETAAEVRSAKVTAFLNNSDRIPSVDGETVIVTDPQRLYTNDGAKFFSCADTENKIPDAKNRWIGYVSGHDSPAIWLVSAPSLLGPWKYEHAVVSVPGGGGRTFDNRFQGHVASPDVKIVNGRVKLFYHGVDADDQRHQPTVVAESTDGGNTFGPSFLCLPTDLDNYAVPWRTSTSYARITLHNGIYHAVYQGTTGQYPKLADGYSYTNFPLGYAISSDGLTFNQQEPLAGVKNGDSGIMGGTLYFLNGSCVLVASARYRSGDTQKQEVVWYAGPTPYELRRIGTLPIGRREICAMPEFHVENGKLYMVGGAFTASNEPVISAFELKV